MKHASTLLKFAFITLYCCTFFTKAQIVTYSFTTCGATGSLGPTQAQINSAYTGTNPLTGSVISNSGIQTWTVPSTALYRIQSIGASGGNAPSYSKTGGAGASMQGEFNLTAGTVLKIVVGQVGQNGCGNAGGGGGSYVAMNNTLALVVAGGGGGCSSDVNGVNAVTVTAGTADSSPTTAVGGTNGGGGSVCTSGTHNGGGGGGYNAGAGGNGVTISGGGGFSFLNGSVGGSGFLNSQVGPCGGFGGGGGGSYCTVGGGGGGGYSGGAGGEHYNNCSNDNTRTGGGGGGSFNGGTNQINAAAFNIGDGQVLITRLCFITLNSSAPNGLGALCAGQSVTLSTNAASGILWSTGGTGTSIVVSPSVTTTYSVSGTSTANCLASAAIQLTVNNSVPSLTVSSTGNTICLGQAVALTPTGALTYTWVNPGISSGIAFNPLATTVYTLLGQNGCGTSTALTTVSVAPLQVAAISSNSVVCASNPASLTAAAAATGFTWQPIGTTGANIVVSPSVATIYTVTASNGTCLGTATVAVNTNPNPTVTIAASSSVACSGSAVTMTASGGISYTWYPGGSNGASYTATPTSPTLYSVVASNSFGCSSWANQVVLTSPGPTLSVNASSSLVCSGTQVTLTAGGASSYSWNTGATTPVISDSPLSTTQYTVTGTSNNCSTTQTLQVSVFNPSMAISGPTAICRGQSASLTASPADSYTWSNGAPFVGISVSPTVSTVYSVAALTASGNISCPSSASVNLQVNPLPTLTAVASKTSVCRGQSFTLSASGASSYSWNTGANTASIVASSTLVANVNYTVSGTDANGCSNSTVITIKVNSCIGLEEVQSLRVSLFPNPSQGIFKLELNQAANALSITDINGKTLWTEAGKTTYTINLMDYAKGIYILKVSGNGSSQYFKLFKE